MKTFFGFLLCKKKSWLSLDLSFIAIICYIVLHLKWALFYIYCYIYKYICLLDLNLKQSINQWMYMFCIYYVYIYIYIYLLLCILCHPDDPVWWNLYVDIFLKRLIKHCEFQTHFCGFCLIIGFKSCTCSLVKITPWLISFSAVRWDESGQVR